MFQAHREAARRTWVGRLCAIALACSALHCPVEVVRAPVAAQPVADATPAQVELLRQYVHRGWHVLRRSNMDLVRAAPDPKRPSPTGKWPVYIAADEDLAAVRQRIQSQLTREDMRRLEIRQLHGEVPTEHGVLYLPHPYVVPGGRFNEMYGWDSYFILLGLLRDGDTTMARNVTDNFLYEVEHYGMVLNANRSYYLTRSQPPFLSRMVLAVHGRFKNDAWLRAAVPLLAKYYDFWRQPPHATANGLARYADLGRGPAPEVVSGEFDSRGVSAYQRVKDYFKAHPAGEFDVSLFYDAANDTLTDAFYAGDRAMRESGFDSSNRFGPFNAAILDYNPVCLNSLLYVMENDMADIHATLGDTAQADVWRGRAKVRAALVNKLNWDDSAGMYFDYDFKHEERRNYPFITTFFPLWAGLASPAQATRVMANLKLFEAPGGLKTSTTVTGHQWDAPFGWAPLQLIAIDGMRRYGHFDAAERISVNYLSLLVKEFQATHGMFEKYDVTTRQAPVQGQLLFGYTSNEVGFGWTNGVFSELYATLPVEARDKVRRLNGVATP